MLKHLRTRNSGLIYEILVGRLITEVRDNQKKDYNPPSLYLIKKYFKKGTELHKDLQIYNYLLESKPKKKVNIPSLLKEIIDSDPIDLEKLKNEVYTLCGDVKKYYRGLNEFFNVEVSNYKFLASVYQLLEFYRGGYSDPNSIEQRMLCENFILYNINRRLEESKIVKEKIPNMGTFSQSVLLEKFINKYRDKLSNDQFAIVYRYMKGESKVLKESVNDMVKKLKGYQNDLPSDTKKKVVQCIKKINECKEIDTEDKLKIVIYGQGLIEELSKLNNSNK